VSDDQSAVPRARQLVQLARWAAHAYSRYDVASVRQIAHTVALATEADAERDARHLVQETGVGVLADAMALNLLASRGIIETYGERDYVSPRFDVGPGLVELPRPAGVVLCLTGPGNDLPMVYAAILLALLTRNALLLSPDPGAGAAGTQAAHRLAAVAIAAGAPAGAIQVADPSAAVRLALIDDHGVDLVVRSGPGSNVPVFVDATADLDQASGRILASTAFDNSTPSGSESVLIVEDAVAEPLLAAMQRAGGYLLAGGERDLIRATLFPNGGFDPELIGRDATVIAARAGVRVPPQTRVLLAPFDQVLIEELLAHGKPGPVLGVVQVPDQARGIRAAVAVLRLGAATGSAVIHSRSSPVILDYAAATRARRVIVNRGGNPGRPELEPEHLITWTRIDAAIAPADHVDVNPWRPSPVPSYPLASNLVEP
jgi:acetaldehyde dehydrogenase / alcohol dehydrogenase